jgi:ABC transporter substrate binding protein
VRRRAFITLLGGAAVAWPLAADAQQPAMPVVGLVTGGSPEAAVRMGGGFRGGLNEGGYVEGQNVTVEYQWLDGQYDRLPSLMADLNFFATEYTAKRLALLHELVPKAVHIAVLVNPTNVPATESALRDLPEAARAMGLQIQVLKASTKSEIEAAFATLVRDRAEALYVAGDVFFTSRRVQLATLAATNRIPASYPSREAVEVGGLMGYATDRVDMYRQVGAYTGQILKGANPTDLPVLQSTKFEFVINM